MIKKKILSRSKRKVDFSSVRLSFISELCMELEILSKNEIEIKKTAESFSMI